MNVLKQIEIEEIEHQFLGKMFNNIRENVKERRDDRHNRRMERIEVKSDARASGGGFLQGIGSSISNAFGRGGQIPQNMGINPGYDSFNDEYERENAGSRNMILIVVALLVVVSVAFVVIKNRKNVS